MLSLIFLPITIAIAVCKMSFSIILGLFHGGMLIGAIALFGVLSLLGGIISAIFGLVWNLLPLILIVAGIALIAFANKKEPETVEQHVSDSMDIFKEKISSSM